MELNTISQLINIRTYITTAVNNYSLSKDVVRQFDHMLVVIDKRITEALLSDHFKETIGFSDAKTLVAEAARVNNIKSGLRLDEFGNTVRFDSNKK